MSAQHLDLIRKRLKAYADGGVIRGFTETPTRAGKTQFQFRWLAGTLFTLVFDEKTGQLTLKDAFPNVPAKSHVYTELKDFIEGRYNRKLPAHRRIDSNRAAITCRNRSQKVSIVVDVKRNQYTYALKKLLNLMNELWTTLDQQYMWANFDIPEE